MPAEGFQEVVLTGVHLTSYGRDLAGKPSLADVGRSGNGIGNRGNRRIRLGSLEPVVVTEAFVQAIRSIDKLCPQFHLALQSGSDSVLRRMKRRYNTSQFQSAAKRLEEAFPNVALTTDVIVGFPGETEAEFQETLDFCQKTGFMKIHAFPYSRRKGTPAAVMPDQMPKQIKNERVRRLIEAGEALSAAYRKRVLNTVQPVLIEEKQRNGQYAGYTPQYIPIVAEHGVVGEIIPMRLYALSKEGMRGEPANEEPGRR